MNIPPKFKFFNRKCPYCGTAISYITAFCIDCFTTIVLPEREKQKAAELKAYMKTRKKITP